MTQIRDSSEDCKLCDLIADTVRDVTMPHTDDVMCHLLWEMDGRTSAKKRAGHKANRTRRLRICWDDPRLKSHEAYIMLVAPPKYNKSDIDYPGLLNEETQFLGRRIGSNHNKKNLIREFLRLCETGHDHRCSGKLGIEDPFRRTLSEPYFGVIDIENESLVPLPYERNGHELRFEPYATVSYVWGPGHSRQHATRISNIQSRRKSGGLCAVIRQLPKALQQSINLVPGLGIRYIWIDALCIVQDSSHSWNLNARAMHLIYGNSTLTICAADGMDATAGLKALDDNHKPRQKVVNYAEGVYLMLHRPAETSIQTTQWNKRAWTFQERLLSKRCLIFTEGKIFFQCRSTGMSEDVFSDRQGKGWSLDLIRAPLQMLSQLKVRAFWFYAHCVALYTMRDLYEPFDILAAFSGMCKLMEETMRAPFVFGLPISHFDLALLWQPVGKASLLEMASVSEDPKYKDMRFPSWPWCGWKNEGAVYDSEMVSGCFADVRAWIFTHTWIDWHIRDGYGTLRRLWDIGYAEEDRSEDARWKGYSALTSSPEPDHVGESDYSGDESEQMSDRETSDEGRERERGERGEPDQYDRREAIREPRRIRRPPVARYEIPDPRMNDPRVYGPGMNDPRMYGLQMDGPQNYMRANGPYTMTADMRRKENTIKPQVARSLQQRKRSRFLLDADRFGRSYHGGSIPAPMRFTLTLPEDPYNVLTTENMPASSSSRQIDETFPDQPFLQFFTWRASFHVLRSNSHSDLGANQPLDGCESSATEPEAALCRCEITDRRGDKCGSVVVDNDWLRNKEGQSQTLFEFIAISDAKEFTSQEFADWTYYIPKERIESEWDLYYVLLVEFYPEEGIYRRVALGKVFKAAFTHLVEEEWKEIILG